MIPNTGIKLRARSQAQTVRGSLRWKNTIPTDSSRFTNIRCSGIQSHTEKIVSMTIENRSGTAPPPFSQEMIPPLAFLFICTQKEAYLPESAVLPELIQIRLIYIANGG